MRRHMPMLVAGIALAAIAATGCSSDDAVTGANAATRTAEFASVPTFEEIDAALALDAQDEAVVKDALAEWQHASGEAGSGPPRMFHREMAFVAAVAPSLDNDQLAKLVALISERREERMQQMRERHREHPQEKRADHRAAPQERRFGNAEERADRHAGWLDAVLGLTDEQLARVKTALRTLTQTQASIHEAVRSGDATRDDAREKMRAAHDAFREALTSILTAEQKTRLAILEPLLPAGGPRRA